MELMGQKENWVLVTLPELLDYSVFEAPFNLGFLVIYWSNSRLSLGGLPCRRKEHESQPFPVVPVGGDQGGKREYGFRVPPSSNCILLKISGLSAG